MSGHTKEPWRVHYDIDAGEWPMVMAGGAIVANVNPTSFHSATGGFVEMPSMVNAERIVACVNACEGIVTVELVKAGLVGAFLFGLIEKDAEIDNLRAKVAELEQQAAIGRRAVVVLDRVRLHASDTEGGGNYCVECGEHWECAADCELAAILRDAEQSGVGL